MLMNKLQYRNYKHSKIFFRNLQKKYKIKTFKIFSGIIYLLKIKKYNKTNLVFILSIND